MSCIQIWSIRQRDKGSDKRVPTYKRIFGLSVGSFFCLHLLACTWHYLGEFNVDWQPEGQRVSWLNIDDEIADLSFERRLWSMDKDASAWGRYAWIIRV
jgi:hypothetical protein